MSARVCAGQVFRDRGKDYQEGMFAGQEPKVALKKIRLHTEIRPQLRSDSRPTRREYVLASVTNKTRLCSSYPSQPVPKGDSSG